MTTDLQKKEKMEMNRDESGTNQRTGQFTASRRVRMGRLAVLVFLTQSGERQTPSEYGGEKYDFTMIASCADRTFFIDYQT
jgi:hypothetical protein